MKTSKILLLVLAFVSFGIIPANAVMRKVPVYLYSLFSLEKPSDARIMALGNSLVADYSGNGASFSNPATLAMFKGVSASYHTRWFDYYNELEDCRLQSYRALLETPIGVFGLKYDRFDKEYDFVGTTVYSPGTLGYIETGILNWRFFDYTAALSYGVNITDNIAIGVNGKMFNQNAELSPGIVVDTLGNIMALASRSNPAYLCDIGLLFHFDGFLSESNIADQISLGIALQNFGSDLRIKYTTSAYDYIVQLPRYLRVGMSYSFRTNEDIPLLKCQISAEYRKWLNHEKGYEREVDFGGAGFEAKIFDLLFLRIGGESQPITNVFGEEGTLNFRYGVGLSLSAKRIGIELPLRMLFDYGVQPLNNNFYLDKKNMDVFSFKLMYDSSVFE